MATRLHFRVALNKDGDENKVLIAEQFDHLAKLETIIAADPNAPTPGFHPIAPGAFAVMFPSHEHLEPAIFMLTGLGEVHYSADPRTPYNLLRELSLYADVISFWDRTDEDLAAGLQLHPAVQSHARATRIGTAQDILEGSVPEPALDVLGESSFRLDYKREDGSSSLALVTLDENGVDLSGDALSWTGAQTDALGRVLDSIDADLITPVEFKTDKWWEPSKSYPLNMDALHVLGVAACDGKPVFKFDQTDFQSYTLALKGQAGWERIVGAMEAKINIVQTGMYVDIPYDGVDDKIRRALLMLAIHSYPSLLRQRQYTVRTLIFSMPGVDLESALLLNDQLGTGAPPNMQRFVVDFSSEDEVVLGPEYPVTLIRCAQPNQYSVHHDVGLDSPLLVPMGVEITPGYAAVIDSSQWALPKSTIESLRHGLTRIVGRGNAIPSHIEAALRRGYEGWVSGRPPSTPPPALSFVPKMDMQIVAHNVWDISVPAPLGPTPPWHGPVRFFTAERVLEYPAATPTWRVAELRHLATHMLNDYIGAWELFNKVLKLSVPEMAVPTPAYRPQYTLSQLAPTTYTASVADWPNVIPRAMPMDEEDRATGTVRMEIRVAFPDGQSICIPVEAKEHGQAGKRESWSPIRYAILQLIYWGIQTGFGLKPEDERAPPRAPARATAAITSGMNRLSMIGSGSRPLPPPPPDAASGSAQAGSSAAAEPKKKGFFGKFKK